MRATSVNRETPGGFYMTTICVFISLLAGCTFGSTPPQTGVTVASRTGLTQTLRVIIYFKQQASDNKQLSAAISAACHCQPVFLRAYSSDSLIYEIVLPQGETFETFETTLMRDAAGSGIRMMEQDRIMQPQ
jgi:hypothetical protein